MRRIPKSFMLGGSQWSVVMVSPEEMEKIAGEEAYGHFDSDILTIHLVKPSRTFKRSNVLQAFYHELFHAIFYVANHRWDDEKLVDQCGNLLHQVVATAEF